MTGIDKHTFDRALRFGNMVTSMSFLASGAKCCQVFPYAPYMEWFCMQCVAIYTIDNKIFNLNMI